MAAIQANVTNQQIGVTVGETQIDVAVSGGVGPTGPSGTVSVSAPITNSGTSTAATVGLSTGTGLAVSGGSLTVSYGATAGTACQGNDSRLSDAREWSASTVTQADAEAGTSTSRFAFTPLRVFQAIAAWWAGSAAKTKLDGIAAGATANATDAQLRDRSTHTGTQSASTISDFTAAVIAAAPPTTNASLLTSGTLPDARLSASIARTSDVTSAVAAVVNAAPATLDTLNELAAALGNDASFATTVTNALAAKAPLASPTFTGTVSGVTAAMVGLGNVDNTSDASKPVSTAQAAADAAVASAAAADATTKANAAQAAAVQRANHTGTQTASTISDFSSAASAAAPVQSVAGKTGTVTLVKGDVGLGSVDNTSDASKPISTATQTALDGKAALSHAHSVSDITATGTRSSSTYLRGDGVWSTAGTPTTGLQIDRTGNWAEQAGVMPMVYVAPQAVEVDGVYTRYSGKWIASWSYIDNTTNNIPRVSALTFQDLEGITGALSTNSQSLATLSLPSLVYVGSNFAPSSTSLTTLSLPSLVYVGGNFNPNASSLTTLSLPSLVYVGGNFAPSTTSLTTLSLPSLRQVVGTFNPSFLSALTTLSLPALQTAGGTFSPSNMGALTTLSLPAVRFMSGIQMTSGFGALANVTLPPIGTLKAMNGNVAMTGMALTTASVDGILATLASLDGTNGTFSFFSRPVDISGGTTAPPSNLGSTTAPGSSFVCSGTTCTVNLTNHGYSTGTVLRISGVTVATNANRYATITAVNANQFTYSITSQNATGAGTATIVRAGPSVTALIGRFTTLTTN